MNRFRYRFRSRAPALLCALGLALTGACSDAGTGDGGAGGSPEEDPAADACEHFRGGPFVDVTAGIDESQAEDVGTEHSAHRITLSDDTMGGWAGYVIYPVAEGGEYVFFTDAEVSMTLHDANGAPIEWEQECASGCTDACDDVAQARTVDFATVGTYYLGIGSDLDPRVTLVVIEAGEHEHEHE
jgi:hypothetical protein